MPAITSPFSALRLSGRLMVIQNALVRFSRMTLSSVICRFTKVAVEAGICSFIFRRRKGVFSAPFGMNNPSATDIACQSRGWRQPLSGLLLQLSRASKENALWASLMHCRCDNPSYTLIKMEFERIMTAIFSITGRFGGILSLPARLMGALQAAVLGAVLLCLPAHANAAPAAP